MSSASSPSECGETTETSGRLKASRAPAVSRSGVEDPTEIRPERTEQDFIDYDIRDMHRATLSYRTPILPQLHCTKPMLVHPM